MEIQKPVSESRKSRPCRGSLVLLLVSVLFAAPVLVAIALRMAGGEPSRTRNYGEILQPPVSIADVALQSADGVIYVWRNDQRIWRILVVPPAPCDSGCAALADTLHRVWQTQNREADRVHVLWVGLYPPSAPRYSALYTLTAPHDFAQRLPQSLAGTLGVYLVDPAGFVALRYPEGFDPTGLRKDLARLLK